MSYDQAVPAIEPARVHVAAEVIEDLRDRLRRTRWFDGIDGSGWEYGTDVAYLRELCEYWATGFDWYAVEERFNAFDQVAMDVDGQRLHAFHQRSPPPRCDPAAPHPRVARLGHRVHRRHRAVERP